MERKTKRRLLGCGCIGVVLGLSALAVLFWFAWPIMSARRRGGPVVEVVTCRPGMSAYLIEKTISTRIERSVNQANGVDSIASRSLDGVSVVRATFGWDVQPGVALAQVEQLARNTLPALPPNTQPPIVLLQGRRSAAPVGVLTVSSPTADERTLTDVAQLYMRGLLLPYAGALPSMVRGGQDNTIVIHLDPEKLSDRKLTAEDVKRAVEQIDQKYLVSRHGRHLLLQSNGRAIKVNDVNELAIRREERLPVSIREIGRVEEFSAVQTRLRFDRRRAVGLLVYLQNDAKSTEVNGQITERLSFLEELFLLHEQTPRDIKLRWTPFGSASKEWFSSDEGILTIHLRAPSHTRLVEMEKRVSAVEEFLEKNIPAPDRQAIVSEVGMTPDESAIYTANAGPMDATLFVSFSAERALSTAAYAAKLRGLLREDRRFADLRFFFASHDMPRPVDIRIEERVAGEGLKLARDVRNRLAAVNGTADVDIVQRMDAPQIVIRVDTQKVEAVGLKGENVLWQTLAALKSRRFLDSDMTRDLITVPFSDDPDVKWGDVLETPVTATIKLRDLVSQQRIQAAVEIDHYSLQRVFNVRANIDNRGRSDVIADIRKMIQELTVPQGMRVELVE